jgi:hypothetical protein
MWMWMKMRFEATVVWVGFSCGGTPCLANWAVLTLAFAVFMTTTSVIQAHGTWARRCRSTRR